MNLKRFLESRFYFLPLILMLFCVGAYAQQNSEISGTVTDKQGAVVSGAKVTLIQPATGLTKETVSNDAGVYDFPALNIGTYDLKVTAAGFEAVVQQGLQLNISQTLESDIQLTVGSINETVTVAANAIQVQADSNVVSTLISADQISEIATQNRNLTALATLGLGVSSGLPDSNTPTSVASSSFISVNGLRHAHNIWLIDGGEADDRGGAGGASIMPSQDSIAQFEMLTSNYPPDYGISSGATISLALKSGTQNFHGTLWEFNRNTDYNANSYFNKQSNPIVGRTPIDYNIYGFNIGGPIFIPHQYNTSRQRTFFFWNEEWRKLKQGSSPNVVQAIPAADYPVAGQGLNYVSPAFSPGIKLQVPTVGDPAFNAKLLAAGIPVPVAGGAPVYFPNNVIPASLIDANAVLYLNTKVFPPGDPGTDKVVSSASQPINVRDDVVRIDHHITDKWAILGHYLGDSVTQSYAAPMLGWSGASYNTITSVLNNPSNSAAVKLSGAINSSLLVEASFNYDGNVIGITNSPNSQVPAGWSVNRFFGNSSKNLPNINLGAPYNTQENPGSAPWKNAARDYSPKVDVSYTVGKHAMKYGFSYNRYTKNQQIFGDPGGSFNFGSLTNDSAVDFMLGLANTYDQAQALPIRHYVNQTTSAYVMDNWRATPRLTLQLGIRYDALPHAYERGNNLSNFDPASYVPTPTSSIFLGPDTNQLNANALTNVNGGSFYLNGIQIAGQNKFPKGLVQNDYNTIQPRVGFSNDLFGNGKTILRGGIGSFYERVQGNDVYNAAANEPFYNDPTANSVYVSDPHTTWTTGQTASTPNFAQGITTLATTYKAPGVVQFSLGVQREVAPSVIWVVQYVGNLAWHQPVRRQINNYSLDTPLGGSVNPTTGSPLPVDTRANAGDPQNKTGTNSGGTSLPNGDQLRNYPGIGQIAQQENTSNANYSGFQTGIRAQNKHGLTGEFDYTWSHEIDLTSDDNNCCLSNPYNLKYDKGSGGLDRRHIVSINYIYKLPTFFQGNGLTHSVLDGWEVAGVVAAQSGVILNNTAGGSAYGGPGLSISYDTIGLGGGYQNRPNISGKVHYPKKQLEWFDPTVFSAPLPAWAGGPNQGFGNASRDSVVGPGRLNFSTSLYKSFAIKEYAHFEFRAESFNTFNHTQYNNVGYQFGSGNFGQVTNTFDPRTLELGAKLIF